jgi:UDP-glucose 4-epimerase
MKRCLVTGASGFVGNNLARRLLEEGHEVHVLLRKGHTDWNLRNILADLRIHLVDLRDKRGLISLLANIRPEWIFHLAAFGAYSWQTDVEQMLQTNVLGTTNLIDAALNCDFEAFVNTGSSSEYGFKDYPPSEDVGLEPNSYYAVTKASATLFCRYTARNRNRHMPTLRLYSAYGPYEHPSRLIPTLVSKGLSNLLPPLVDPNISRDFVYVDDVIQAYLLAATVRDQSPGEIFNVGTGVQTSIREVVDIARMEMGITAEPEWGSMENRSWDTATWICNYQHIRAVLGWSPEHDFRAGLKATINWQRNNR